MADDPKEILLARSSKRERATADGEAWTEYRARTVDREERAQLADKYGYDAVKALFGFEEPVVLERRHVRTGDDAGAEYGAGEDPWEPLEFGGDLCQTIEEVGDSAFCDPDGEGLHPLRDQYCEFRQRRSDDSKRLRELEARVRPEQGLRTSPLQHEYEGRYEAELKKARLHSKAKREAAPSDKVEAIRKRVAAEYQREKAEIDAEIETLTKRTAQRFCDVAKS